MRSSGSSQTWCASLACCSAARMWPFITAAAEKQAKEMLPDMLEESKPMWMTTLKMHK